MRQKNTFHKRLDQDTENRLMEQGKFRAAKNARISSSNSDNVGAAESMPSNTIFTALYSWPTGTNKCIGTCPDVKNNAIVYCFYNSNGDHRIISWDADTNVLTDILPPAWDVTALGWTSASKLWNMRIVESGTSQIMFFHEVQGVPMRINLGIRNERGATYTLSLDDITVARKPPVSNPTFAYAVDSTSPSSYIQDKFFQFRYRYIYEDKEQSTWSPWSNISIPPQDGVAYNKIIVTFNSGVKGVTKVEIARREGNGSTSTGTTNPELYIFNTWIKGSNSDNTNYTVDFFNSEVLTPVSITSANKLFDQVPQVVGCQEVIQSNQVIYGDITEGYGNITDANVVINDTYDKTKIFKLTLQDNSGSYKILNDFSIPAGDYIVNLQINTSVYWNICSDSNFFTRLQDLIINLGYTAVFSGSDLVTNIPYTNFVVIYLTPKNYGTVTSVIDWGKKTTANGQLIYNTTGYQKITWDEYNLNAVNVINNTDFEFYGDIASGLVTITIELFTSPSLGMPSFDYNIVLLDVTNNTPIWYLHETYVLGSQLSVVLNVSANTIVGKKLAIAIENLSTYYPGFYVAKPGGINRLTASVLKGGDIISTGFKSGSTHKFGLVYYDKYMRQSGVQAITGKYVKFPVQRSYPEYFNSISDLTDGYIPQLNWEIKHLPPDWAYYYSWAYDGGSVQNYTQAVALVKDAKTDVSMSEIKVTPTNLYTFKYIYNSFSVGDFCRLLLKQGPVWNGTTVKYYNTVQNAETEYIEGVITGFSSTEIIIQTLNTKISVNNLASCLVEFYSITKSELFYEQTIYEIGNPTASNRYHKGPSQNQNPSNPTGVPAKGDFIGNSYFRFIPNEVSASDTNPYWVDYLVECSSITYNAESNFWNKGRAMIETADQTRERNRYMYRWGNQLLQNTNVNGMSTFDSGNYGVLSAKFGTLTAMREIGYTLKMLQESNYSTAFIGRKELQNADGSTNLVVTDYLIGTINPSEDLYGTKYPGSVLVNGRNLYWLDTIKGKYIRESGNQPFPISDYNMVNYWRQASKMIDSLGYVVFTGFDKQTEQLFVTYKREAFETATTISFYDPERDGIEKGWVAEHDFNKVIDLAITQIDMYGWVGQTFTSALASGIYKHNSTSSYLNLYGEQKTFSITSVFNANFDEIKVFLAHWVKANKSWDLTVFTTPASAMNPNGMRTYLVPGNYALKEAAYYADLKNDGYTKGFAFDDSAAFKQQMVSGRPLREQAILVELSYSGSSIFVLFDHEIGFIQSPWT